MRQAHSDPLVSYERDGYVVISDVFSPEEKAALVEGVDEVGSWPETPQRWMHYYETNPQTQARQLCRIENFVPYHDRLRALLARPRLTDVVARIVGEPPLLYKDKINFKLPGGNGFATHQDAPAFTGQGPSQHITVMVAVDRATVENGCLEVVVGGHTLGNLPHTAPGGSIPASIVRELTFAPLELEPGDVVFFGAHIPHRSGPNRSTGPRRALYFTFNPRSEGDKREAYYRDKREKFPPECERVPGRDYAEGAKVYNLANPIR
ncbi:MAG: phytanoyl-CoA dioxygenase family protein [Polyangiales bacterium]